MAKKKDDPVQIVSHRETDSAAEKSKGVDRLFADPRSLALDFQFNHETAAVFDDMVSRSVPFYDEIQRMVGELAAEFAVPGTNLYDLGCATGTTLGILDDVVDPAVRFVGVDNSKDMLAKARQKFRSLRSGRHIDLVNADLHQGPVIEDASVVVMLLTLQFLRPLQRDRILQRIVEGLRDDGCLILVEKQTSAYTLLNRIFINNYYAFKKRNGYSDVEIAQKREALENVLIPYHHEENYELFRKAGLRQVDEFFRWYNFTAMVAVK